MAGGFAATIGNVEWLVAIVVALIGAGAGFAGGYFGARWQAGTNLAEWRRDQLLQFCADLLAAGREITDRSGLILAEFEEPRADPEPVTRIDHARACVELLSKELSDPAQEYCRAVVKAFAAAFAEPIDKKELRSAIRAADDQQRLFTHTARDLLLDTPEHPTLWSLVWARIQSTRASSSIRAAIEKAVAPAPKR